MHQYLKKNFYLASPKIVVNGNHARDFISLLRSNFIKIDRRLTEYISNLVMGAPLPEQSESVKESKHRSSRNNTLTEKAICLQEQVSKKRKDKNPQGHKNIQNSASATYVSLPGPVHSLSDLNTFRDEEIYEREDENTDCPICDKIVNEEDQVLACDICDTWFHISCDSSVTELQYRLYMENENLSYQCPTCLVTQDKLALGEPNRLLLQGATPTQVQPDIQHPATLCDRPFLQGVTSTQVQPDIQHPAILHDRPLLQGATSTQVQSGIHHSSPAPPDNTDTVEDIQDLAKQLQQKQRDLTKWEDKLRRRENNNNKMSKELAAACVLISKLEYELKQERRSTDLSNLAKPNNRSDQPPVLPQLPHSMFTSNPLSDTSVPPPSNPLPDMSAPSPIPMVKSAPMNLLGYIPPYFPPSQTSLPTQHPFYYPPPPPPQKKINK